MALTPVPSDLQASTGSQETVDVVPNNSGSIVTIVTVSYGADIGHAGRGQETIWEISNNNTSWLAIFY
jgi:hypothetical protein